MLKEPIIITTYILCSQNLILVVITITIGKLTTIIILKLILLTVIYDLALRYGAPKSTTLVIFLI